MLKRIEFVLNLEDPQEAAIYRALKPSLKYRRAGAVIRQALDAYLLSQRQPYQPNNVPSQERKS